MIRQLKLPQGANLLARQIHFLSLSSNVLRPPKRNQEGCEFKRINKNENTTQKVESWGDASSRSTTNNVNRNVIHS